MTFNGFVPGPQTSFGDFGSFDITTGTTNQAISLDLFTLMWGGFKLELFLGGVSVDSTTVSVSGPGILHATLALSGTMFDLARVSTTTSMGVADFDNVQIATVPEPSSLVLLGTGVVGLPAYMARRRARTRV